MSDFELNKLLNQIQFNFFLHINCYLNNLSFSFFGTLKAINNSKTYDAVHAWNVPSAFIMKIINAKKKILSVHGVYSKQVDMLHSKII